MSIEAIRAALVAGPTEGPWEIWTSCSWRRIKSGTGANVLEPTVAKSDGHPDLSASNETLAFIAACNPSAIRELLDRLEAAEKDARRWRAAMAQPWVLSSMPGGKGVSITLSIYGVKANPDMEPEDAIDAAMEGE